MPKSFKKQKKNVKNNLQRQTSVTDSLRLNLLKFLDQNIYSIYYIFIQSQNQSNIRIQNIINNIELQYLVIIKINNPMISQTLKKLTPRILIPIFQKFSIDNYMKTYQPQNLTIHHGRTRIDQNSQLFQNPQKLQQFINNQNKLYEKQSKKWSERSKEYLGRVNSRRDQRTKSTTQIYNNYQYYTTVAWYQGRQYTQIWRRPINSSTRTQLVLDIMKHPLIRKYYKTVQLTRTVFSPCSKYIAFGFDLHNNQQISFMIKDIHKNTIISIKNWQQNRIKNIDNIIFDKNDGIFYTKVVNYRSSQIWYQNIKTQQNYLIYTQKNGQYYLDISMSKDNQHIIINSNSKNNSKIWIIQTQQHNTIKLHQKFKMKQLKISKIDSKIYVNHNGKNFIIWKNNSQGNQIILMNSNMEKEQVIHKIDAKQNQTITDIDVFQSYIVLYIRRIVSPVIRIIQLNPVSQSNDNKNTKKSNLTYKTYQIPLPFQYGSIHPGANQQIISNTFLFYINNIFVYNEGYSYNFNTKQIQIKQEFKLTGPKFNVKNYSVMLHQVPSQDGQLIPLTTIVPKKYQNKKNKMLLHCYGHYGLAYQIAFNNTYWAALQNGWSLAYAHVRGGGEKGNNWHSQAIKQQKYKNWNDLEDCVGYLLKNQFTHPNILVLCSHSAGAVTIWNTINRYSHLYKAVVMSYPFLDVLGSLLDPSKPLTQSDYPQFGNPCTSQKSYTNLQSISPYQNIYSKQYPFIYLIAGKNDYRCPLQQIAKFKKRYSQLRQWKQQKQKIIEIGNKGLLIKINQGSHQGVADLGQQLKDGCQMLACMDYIIQQASKDVQVNK